MGDSLSWDSCKPCLWYQPHQVTFVHLNLPTFATLGIIIRPMVIARKLHWYYWFGFKGCHQVSKCRAWGDSRDEAWPEYLLQENFGLSKRYWHLYFEIICLFPLLSELKCKKCLLKVISTKFHYHQTPAFFWSISIIMCFDMLTIYISFLGHQGSYRIDDSHTVER